MSTLTARKRFLNFAIMSLLLFPALLYALTAQQPLPIHQAFQLSTHMSPDNTLIASWKIAPGYYLYKDHFQFRIIDNPAMQLGTPVMPPGISHQDDSFGNYTLYQNQLTIQLPLSTTANGQATLAITYQGCSSNGFCYPPTTQKIPLQLNIITNNNDKTEGIDWLLKSKNSAFITFGFLLLGVLLAFTPCVFPMLPILSSIIVGQNKDITTAKAFSLSLTYVLAMAITYALAGMLVGIAGNNVQSALQHPIAIIIFSALLILLALSLFGFYELQLPSSWQAKITALSNRQRGGTYVSVALMGLLSALIVSPCVSAPLVGALSYISQQGNLWLGGSSLFALGLGMGLPLLLVGTFGGSLLPKAGNWMHHIKNLFGICLLGLALWMLERIIPSSITIWLWALLFIVTAITLGALEAAATAKARIWKSGCFLLLLYGCVIVVSAFQGQDDPWRPFNSSSETKTIQPILNFQTVKNLTEVQQALVMAKQQQKKVLLDFYASWCISCKKLERTLFTDAKIKLALANTLLLRADISKSTAEIQRLTQHFDVIAPPTLILFNEQGVELTEQRIIGEIEIAALLKRLTID